MIIAITFLKLMGTFFTFMGILYINKPCKAIQINFDVQLILETVYGIYGVTFLPICCL